MPAVAMPKDDWTPANLKTHRDWRAKMYRPVHVPVENKPDPAQVVTENRMRQLEAMVVDLRAELDRAREHFSEELKDLAAAAEKDGAGSIDPVDGTLKVRIARVMRVVAAYFGISVKDLKSGARTKEICRLRHIAMYLCRTITLKSLPEIGRHFGNRDHTTVLHAIHKIESLMPADPVLCQEVAELEALFA
jgi:chromosomal replication initiation ATPase DnaA